MEPEVYVRLAEIERTHWWFVARRHILSEVLRRLCRLPREARVLEAGCGTGGNLSMLSRFGEIVAFEPNAQGREAAKRQGPFEIRDGHLPDGVPFAPGQFDLVAALDVLEHLANDRESLSALRDRLRPGGWAIVTVPAFPFLWSEHDEAHHHKRRYRKSELAALAESAGFSVVLVTYFNSLLFPVIVAVRLTKKIMGIHTPDDAMPSPAVNRMLTALFDLERFLVGRVAMPPGASLLALLRNMPPSA
jgi:SAM-dependent methyltransferase